MKILQIPDPEWLTRLRRGHLAWDVKNERFVRVEFAYESPEPGSIAGRIGVDPVWEDDDGYWGGCGVESWFIKQDGTGLDGSQLLMPVERNCPDDPGPLSSVWQIKINSLNMKVNSLNMKVNSLNMQLRITRELFAMIGEAVEGLGENQQEISRSVKILLDIT
jgi:hypothetical protein